MADGLASGSSAVTGAGLADALAAGSSTGSSTVGGAGAADVLTTGSSTGLSTVAGTGVVLGAGASDGTTVVAGAGELVTQATGFSAGSSTALGLGLQTGEYSYPATAFDQGDGATYSGVVIDHSGPWAFAGWFYAESANGSGSAALLQLKGSAGLVSLFYHWGYRRLSVSWSGALEDGAVEVATAIQNGWNFIAVSYDGSTLRAYLKRHGGVAVKVYEANLSFNDAWDPNGIEIRVLGTSTVEQQYWKVWSGGYLTQAEAEAESSYLSVQKTANLYAFYPLIGANLNDYSGLGRNLTPIGTPSSTFDGPLLTSFSMGSAAGVSTVVGAGILADLTKGYGFCEAYADGLAEGTSLIDGVSLPTGMLVAEAGLAEGDAVGAGVGFFSVLAAGLATGSAGANGHAAGASWVGSAVGMTTCAGQGFVTSFSTGLSAGA